jgi:AcrR family transcriptional regulator
MVHRPETSALLTPRERHRRQTREEILDAALAVMSDNGVAALNLTQVARRVGLRQPSLYQYFGSRTAVYDALFERGMQAHHDAVAAAVAGAPPGWAAVRAAMAATLRFAAQNPVLAQFLFTRAVPGFVPSEQAYAPSLRQYELIRAAVATAVECGDLHPAAASERGVALLVTIAAGVASQQAANDPTPGDGEGRFTPLLGPALDMYATYFRPDRPDNWTPWPNPATRPAR